MITLCLDTQVYLNFFDYNDENLDKLEAILLLIDEKQLKIILPEQIQNEFSRNRELKIKESIKKIKESEIKLNLPRLTEGYTEASQLEKIKRDFTDIKNQLLEKINSDIESNDLKADVLIKLIFEKAVIIQLNDEIWEKAQKRFHLGNPPRKSKDINSYGDAIIWEVILEEGRRNKDGDIHFVSIDGDFGSSLEENKLNRFLIDEWDSFHSTLEDGKLYFYKSLNKFFEVHFPQIKVFDEVFLKDLYIDHLIKSYSFDRTRYVISKLEKYGNYSESQLDKIINACVSNDQIYNANYYSDWIWQSIKVILGSYYNKLPMEQSLELVKLYDHKEYEFLKEIYQDIMSDEYNNIVN